MLWIGAKLLAKSLGYFLIHVLSLLIHYYYQFYPIDLQW